MLELAKFFQDWENPTLALVLAGAIGWLVYKTSQWLDAHAKFLDATTKTKILAIENEALNEGVNYILSQVKQQEAQAHVEVSNPVTRFAAQIALNHAAGTLAAHGASPEEVASKILSRLSQVPISTDTTGATVKTASVDSRPLAPIGG